ncbi:hypothetical protein [Pseudazoarcus pumilus]|uniref:hypothetical protein n=1 Tax=Pseudazoarcus pumilus TaxID=2067960 RepID=UPI0026C3D984
MYLIAIGWMYVVTMVAIVNPNPVGGVLTFVFAGLGPLALFLWIFGTPGRRRAKALREPAPEPDDSGSDTGDQASPVPSIQISEANRPVTPSRRNE